MLRSLPTVAAVTLVALLALAALNYPPPSTHAEVIEFDFKDPKGVNTVSFVLDSELEPIMGVAQGISGKVKFDPAKPDATTGYIAIDAKEVKTPNERMTKKLHTEEWLDVENHPEIRFTIKKVMKAGKGPESVKLFLKGELSLRGITKEIDVPADVRHLPGGLEKRMGGKKGDLLVLRTRFIVNRSEYKLGPPIPVVAEKIEIRIALVGMAPQ